MKSVQIKCGIWVIFTGILVITLTACSEYMVKGDDSGMEEMPSLTDQQHTSAEAMFAIEDAKLLMTRATELGGVWRDTSGLIAAADAAFEENDNDKAYELATTAKNEAALALNQSYLEKANHMIGRIKGMIKAEDTSLSERVEQAESAYLDDQGEQAYALSVAMLKDLETPMAANTEASDQLSTKAEPDDDLTFAQLTVAKVTDPAEEASMEDAMEGHMKSAPGVVDVSVTNTNTMDLDDQYKVISGDSLWKISAKPAVYSNPYQWPLIYKINKDTIRDPDLIRPGQVLSIDREASQLEINAAITHAKSRGAWSLGEREQYDQTYLSDADVVVR